MPPPRAVLLLEKKCFGAEVVCQGDQVAAVAQCLERVAGPLEWWITDVEMVSGNPPNDLGIAETPDRCGQTPSFLAWANQVGEEQFMWGVFIAVRPGAPATAMRASPSAQDGDWCDIGDAIAEVRAFDTSFIQVLLADAAVADALRVQFNAEALPPVAGK